MFASYSEGVVVSLNNTKTGAIKFVDDPFGTLNETVNYFLADPLKNNPIAGVLGYYTNIAKASYAHDWEGVANRIGSGTANVAGAVFPKGIKVNTNINLPSFNAYQFAGANGMVISAGAVSVPISASVSSATVASASGVVAGAAVGQNIVYSSQFTGQNSSGGASKASSICRN